LIVVVAPFVVATFASAQAPGDEAAIVERVQSFDRAFVAKDRDKLVLLKVNDAWKIRHSHTSARRRPASAVPGHPDAPN